MNGIRWVLSGNNGRSFVGGREHTVGVKILAAHPTFSVLITLVHTRRSNATEWTN